MKKNQKTATAKKQNVNAAPATTSNALVPFRSVSMNIPLDKIDPSPFNRDRTISEKELRDLADSIALHGVQTDIKVRPMENGRYEIVYGERRFRASLLAGKTTIPAKVEQMTDEQAETCLIIENLQRENYSAVEEGRIFRRKQEEGLSVAAICERFGKKEDYVRSRISLTTLIPEVADMLDREDITLEVAKEFAKYDTDIQKEVYEEHFRHDDLWSWRGIPSKDFAKKLYDKYMTKLDNYRFDKTKCTSCGHNTLNQVLFTDCGACRNMACLLKKNEDYLVDKAVSLLRSDARLHLAVTGNSDRTAAERLEAMGHEVVTLENGLWGYISKPAMPEAPVPEDYESEDDLRSAQDDYEEELKEFKETCSELDCGVSEGTVLKYAVIGTSDVSVYYERVRAQTDENGLLCGSAPESPAAKLRAKDARNLEICYEHINKDLKKVLGKATAQFPASAMTEREHQMLNYVLLDRIPSANRELLGVTGYGSCRTERLKAAETMTEEQRTMLFRMAFMRYCDDICEYNCKADDIDIQLMIEFGQMHFPEETAAVVGRHKAIYDKRHANLDKRIKAIEEEDKQASVVQVSGEPVDAATDEVLAVAVSAAEPTDYPEPMFPQEPEPDYIPYESPAPDEFLPEEIATVAAVIEAAEPADYPEPVFPQEPEPDYVPCEVPAPDEFLPEETQTCLMPLAGSEPVPAAKAA